MRTRTSFRRTCFFRDQAAVQNTNITAHAELIAGVMIANGTLAGGGPAPHTGVARNASLYASATGNQITDADFVRSIQIVGTNHGLGVRATNVSAGAPLGGGESLDGNTLMTQGLDWSASSQNILYVVGGNQGTGGGPVPSDEYNGVTVAFSRQPLISTGPLYFDLWDNNNLITAELPVGGRRAIDLVAPGRRIRMPTLGQAAYTPADDTLNGTSIATPHVTGTAALLQQYAEDRISAGAMRWNANARRHEVMKVILMNSADKIEGALGMRKTISTEAGVPIWANSDARDVPANPNGRNLSLDLRMGTGHLNARRALNQFSSGEYDAPGGAGTVPPVGWDYNSINTNGQLVRYPIAGRLRSDGYLAVTLAWDRALTLNEQPGTTNGEFDYGESFTPSQLTNLNLYLVPRGTPDHLVTDNLFNVWSSVSAVDNVEHIFVRLADFTEFDREYDLVVRRASGTVATNYALAWWGDRVLDAQSGRIGDKVWRDVNWNGLQDVGEAGLAGVGVHLYKTDGTWTASTASDVNGNYEFASVAPGDYYLTFVSPDGYVFVQRDAGTNDALDSDPDTLGRTSTFTVGAGAVLTIDAGLIPGQWASEVLGFSSEFNPSPGDWSAAQALGEPDTFVHGDEITAWATRPMNSGYTEGQYYGPYHYLSVGFETPVYATGVTIRETYGNGFVYRLDLLDGDGMWHDQFWTGTDPSIVGDPPAPADFVLTFPATPYLVKGVRVHINIDHDLARWEEIDAVLLHGDASSGSGGGSAPLGGASGSFATGSSVRVASVRGRTVGPYAAFLTDRLRASIGQQVTFGFSDLRDQTGAPTSSEAFRYSFDFNHDGDFTDPGDIRGAVTPSATFRFSTAGWHVVHGRIFDAQGRYTDFYVRVLVTL